MKKSDYLFKRLCIMQCGKALKNLRSTSRDIIHEQMIRMNEELNKFHKQNRKRVKK